MRVGIIALEHESNTFIGAPTTLADFQRDHLLIGSQIRDVYRSAHHEVSGFLQGLEQAKLTAEPLFLAAALPGGTISAKTADDLIARLLGTLDQAPPLDGLLLAAHGAAVSENHPDLDGHWLTLVRQKVGPQLPIICTIDAHANLSPAMVQAVNGMIAYRTNPHLDQKARGLEAAHLLGRTLSGKIRPVVAAAFPPVAINIERQLTAAEPCRILYDLADEQLRQEGVLSNSVVLGFPYADVPDMGSSFLAVCDGDQALAQRCADQLAAHLLEQRRDFRGEFLGIDQAIDKALSRPGPACLLDMGDNVGGGSPADGTFLAQALYRRRVRSFVCLCDPQAVQEARKVGVGGHCDLTMGGKTDKLHGAPLTARVTVRLLHEGKFQEDKPRHGGQVAFDMGATAVVETTSGLTFQLTSRRIAPWSLHQLTCCQLDPAQFLVVVAKGVHAPVAAYASFCQQMIRVNTPGVTAADMTLLPYHHRRPRLFPFEELA